jgi:hypothetical protein
MKTIQETSSIRDNDNRFMLSGLANRSSASRDINQTISHFPQSAGGTRKRYLAKSKKESSQSRYHNDSETFMTSRSTRRTSIGHYKF